MATKTLYVGNLPYSATEEDLFQHFDKFGPTQARIVEGRGFGFIDVDADKADEAVEAMNESSMGGRKLVVNEARPKAPREGGFGGGGRSGGGGGGYGGGGGGGGYGGRGGSGGGGGGYGGRGGGGGGGYGGRGEGGGGYGRGGGGGGYGGRGGGDGYGGRGGGY